jgi:hypothetical protein
MPAAKADPSGQHSILYLYLLFDENGNYRKVGVSKNPAKRYTPGKLGRGSVEPLFAGDTRAVLRVC